MIPRPCGYRSVYAQILLRFMIPRPCGFRSVYAQPFLLKVIFWVMGYRPSIEKKLGVLQPDEQLC